MTGEGAHSGVAQRRYVVEGLRCAACATAIERALGGIDGILAARVNSATRRLSVLSQDEQSHAKTIDGIVESTLTQLGYSVHRPAFGELGPEDSNTGSPDREGPDVLIALGVAAFAMMNVMGFSVAVWAGLVTDMDPTTRQFMHAWSAAVALPAVLWSGRVFFLPAMRALRSGRISMDAAISLAILAPLTISALETLQGGRHAYYDAAVSLIFFLLIGRWLDQALRARSTTASDNLRSLIAPQVERFTSGQPIAVQIEDLRVGDRLLLHPGMRAPVDGVIEGQDGDQPALLDESILTGESDPKIRKVGETITAGSLVQGAPVILRATARVEDSRLAQIADLTEEAEAGIGREGARGGALRTLAEQWSAWYGAAVLTVACAGFLIWWLWLAASWEEAAIIAVAVLIVTCPCAAGLATPAVAARASALLLKSGVILRKGDALERLAAVDHVILDKTGTLTHPPANPGTPAEKSSEASPERLRPGAEQLAAKLRNIGLPSAILSGDKPAAVARVAGLVGIRDWKAGLSPEDKFSAIVGSVDESGNHRPLMVGDGLNDAPALAAAYVSASPCDAADATRNSADMILLTGNLDAVAGSIALARNACGIIRQNLTFAAFYNIATVPLALAGQLTPAIAAILMSSSSIAVMLNALRLRASA